MKIKYRHHLDPKVEKVYDTEKSLKNNPFIHMSQDEFDAHELKRMEEHKAEGNILEYEIIKEDES